MIGDLDHRILPRVRSRRKVAGEYPSGQSVAILLLDLGRTEPSVGQSIS